MYVFLVIRQSKIYPLNGKVNLGKNTSFYCDGYFFYEWHHFYGKINDNDLNIILDGKIPLMYHKKLLIYNTSLEQGGSYVCLGGLSKSGYFIAKATLKVYGMPGLS